MVEFKICFPKETFSFKFIQFNYYTCHNLRVWDNIWFEHWFGHFATLGLNIVKLINKSVSQDTKTQMNKQLVSG